jgi:hypothetical protein
MAKSKGDLIRIEYVPLSQRQPATRNPKLHALEDIKLSLRRFGFVMPGAINEATGRMVVGHGRGDAMAEMKTAGEDPPARIVEREGEWYIPVLRGISFASEEEAEAYLIADNKLTELAGYDEGLMAQMLTDLNKSLGEVAFQGLGIDEEEMNRLLGHVEECPPPELPTGDRVPFRQMTFTVHDDQFEEVEQAIAKAKKEGGGASLVNENGNGNALAWICQRFNHG